jgi:hypothetical protein
VLKVLTVDPGVHSTQKQKNICIHTCTHHTHIYMLAIINSMICGTYSVLNRSASYVNLISAFLTCTLKCQKNDYFLLISVSHKIS